MKQILAVLMLALSGQLKPVFAAWEGVDESVVGHYAAAAGRPAVDALINTDQGDLLLFVFLLAGAIGGFIMGYYFRQLFSPEQAACSGSKSKAVS